MRRREIIRGVAEKLKHNDLQIIALTVGVCPFCFGNISPSERRTYEQLALLQGASDGDVIEKKRKRILKKFKDALKKQSFKAAICKMGVFVFCAYDCDKMNFCEKM